MTRTDTIGRCGLAGRRTTLGATHALALPVWLALAAAASASPAQEAAPDSAREPVALHVTPGERLTYVVRVARLGTVGRGSMVVEGPVDVRGTPTYRLHFAFRTRVGPVRVVNESESWLDVASGAVLRFRKHERSPLSKHDEAVELYPAERRWEGADGRGGASPSAQPMDELSFIYLLRTLPLAVDSTYRLERHFDAARNPVLIRVLGRDTLTTPAGRFPTIVVEMRVTDPRRYRGQGTLRFHLSDDARRVPVRMESTMPIVGAVTLELESRAPELAAGATPR
ncbi:MAG TPA: DUF3108 domain-containing protein [Gemmatimonadaceae bacterium]|nr:DUF3108 domain-containing protein [Gemmatimonadaceae bacterium]